MPQPLWPVALLAACSVVWFAAPPFAPPARADQIGDPDEIPYPDAKPRAHDEVPFPDAKPRAHDEISYPDAGPRDPDEIRAPDAKPRAHDEIPFPDAKPRMHDVPEP